MHAPAAPEKSPADAPASRKFVGAKPRIAHSVATNIGSESIAINPGHSAQVFPMSRGILKLASVWSKETMASPQSTITGADRIKGMCLRLAPGRERRIVALRLATARLRTKPSLIQNPGSSKAALSSARRPMVDSISAKEIGIPQSSAIAQRRAGTCLGVGSIPLESMSTRSSVFISALQFSLQVP